MTACPSCSGISNTIHVCNNMCENIMKGCLAQYAALDADWNHFIGKLIFLNIPYSNFKLVRLLIFFIK